MEEERIDDLAKLVHIESSNPEKSTLRSLADVEVQAIKETLTLAGPPCGRCHFFRFEVQTLENPGHGKAYNGYRFCHTPREMERDFSCFHSREGYEL